MRLTLSILKLTGLFFLIASCSAEPMVALDDKQINAQCVRIAEGKFLVENLTIGTSAQNSYLLNCSISVLFPAVSKVSGVSTEKERAARKANKIAVANKLLNEALDLSFFDEQKNTLLHNLALSYLDKPWKLEAAKKLLALGADKDAKNEFGDKPVKYAKFNEDKGLVELLSE